MAKVAKIKPYHVKMFAVLPRKAAGDAGRRRDAAGSHDADVRRRHRRQQQPTRRLTSRSILAGGGAGNLKGGRHIQFKDMPLANLHLTLLDQFGVRMDKHRRQHRTGSMPQILSLELKKQLQSRAVLGFCAGRLCVAASVSRLRATAADRGREEQRRGIGAGTAEAACDVNAAQGDGSHRTALGGASRQCRARRSADSRRREA